MTLFIHLMVILTLEKASAAIPVQQVATEKTNYYMSEGVFVGGHTQENLTLFAMRRSAQEHLGERLVFDIGATRPGFFHISIQKKPLRILIDLENASKSSLTAHEMNNILKKSKLFSGADLFQDPVSKSLTIELKLKRAVKAEVFELASDKSLGRIVLDVK